MKSGSERAAGPRARSSDSTAWRARAASRRVGLGGRGAGGGEDPRKQGLMVRRSLEPLWAAGDGECGRTVPWRGGRVTRPKAVLRTWTLFPRIIIITTMSRMRVNGRRLRNGKGDAAALGHPGGGGGAAAPDAHAARPAHRGDRHRHQFAAHGDRGGDGLRWRSRYSRRTRT